MRIRIALALGAFLLGGAAITGTALAAQPAPPTTVTSKPAPTAEPTRPGSPTSTAPETAQPTRPGEPTAMPTQTQVPTTAPKVPEAVPTTAPKVPTKVPAGPTGDLHLPAVTESF